ncbi:MAG TPA: hypothetical protein VFF14_10445 [Candidatus Deferrimicrobium sp.]|nr:hypothetical protein [Candidatus Deferrimicrobium sp.]
MEQEAKTVDVKCICGKIVSQQKERLLVIKCRHCKRLVLIHLDDLTKIEYR